MRLHALRHLAAVLAAATALAAPGHAAAQERAQAFTGARLLTMDGPAIDDGVLVVEDGRIAAVGPRDRVRIPDGAVVHDVKGRTIMPGLVDTHSHIGGGDGGDRSDAMHGEVRILDAIDPRDDGIKRARAGGVTTANVMPGSGHLMSGQTAYLKLREAQAIEELLFCADPLREICGGMKMANGTNPRGSSPFPGTRAKAAAIVREKFVKAQEYRRKVAAAGRDSTKLPPRDLELEALGQVLDGRRVVHFHTHRHDDILTALRLAREFGFRVVLQHVSEAWKVAGEIAEAGAPASIIVLDAPGGKLEASEIQMDNGAVLERAGVPVAFHTDDGITDSRWFLRSAALGVRAGMSREKALEALTIAPARMLGLDARLGSLTAGKDADFVVLSGDPLSVYTLVEQTWVEGEKLFDRSDPDDRPYAVGGYDLMDDRSGDVHAGMEGHD